MPRKLATQKYAGATYDLSERTIRRYIEKGIITGYRMPGGRAIRVDLDELEQAITTIPTVGTAPGHTGDA